MPRRLVVLVQCLAAVAVVGNLCALAYWVRKQVIPAEKKPEGDGSGPPRVKPESENKTVVIKMNEATATSYGIAVNPARTGLWRERVTGYYRELPRDPSEAAF